MAQLTQKKSPATKKPAAAAAKPSKKAPAKATAKETAATNRKPAALEVKSKGVPAPAVKKAVKAVPAVKPAAVKTTAAGARSEKTQPVKPVPPSPQLNERFRGLRSMLLAKRDTLLKESKQEIQKYVSGDNRQLVDTAIDEADWAAVEISEDINLKRLSAQRQLLNDVDECLRKLNEGTYGTCEDCGEEISEKRLRVIPTATLCIDCKELREKMSIFDQDGEV